MTVHIFSAAEFKSLTGRSSIARIFKTKGGLDPIIQSLKVFDNFGDSSSNAMAKEALRAIRRNCITWLTANEGVKRSSKSIVEELVRLTTQRHIEMTNTEVEFGSQPRENTPVGNSPTPVPKPAYLRDIAGRDVSRVGNEMGQHLNKERAKRHWGPTTQQQMELAYKKYQQSGGRHTIGAFADHILLPDIEDDPTGKYLGHTGILTPEKIRQGVKYCTEEERKRYSLSIRNGVVFDYAGDPFDTSARRTEFAQYGWAIFVLGFDNVLYSNTHIKDLFHHSSFFAGEPIQCGGEICCIGGRIRYLNCKTGHYKSGKMEFYRLLSFLNYHGVCLHNVLATPDYTTGYAAYWRASKVFAANGGVPTREKAPPQIPSRIGRAPRSSLRPPPRRAPPPPPRRFGPPDKPRERDPEFYPKPMTLTQAGEPIWRLPATPVGPSMQACQMCEFRCPQKVAA